LIKFISDGNCNSIIFEVFKSFIKKSKNPETIFQSVIEMFIQTKNEKFIPILLASNDTYVSNELIKSIDIFLDMSSKESDDNFLKLISHIFLLSKTLIQVKRLEILFFHFEKLKIFQMVRLLIETLWLSCFQSDEISLVIHLMIEQINNEINN
jgi:hypothetical protein